MLAIVGIDGETIVLRLLRVAIEAFQLVYKWSRHRVQWRHLVRCNRYIHIVQILNHGLEFLILDAV